MTAAGTVINQTKARIGRYEWLELIVSGDLPATLKLVAHTLAFHADYTSGENIFPGQEALQAETSLGRTALKSAIAKLIALGLIERVSNGRSHGRGGGAQAAVYRLTHPGRSRLKTLNEGHETTPVDGNEGHKATTVDGNEGHEVANEGRDASNEGREVTPHPSNTPPIPLPPTPQPDRNAGRASARRREGEESLILEDLALAGLGSEEAQAVLEYALCDKVTRTTPRRRLKMTAYLADVRQAVKAKQRIEFESGTKCPDHPWEISKNCAACRSEAIAEKPAAEPIDQKAEQAAQEARRKNPELGWRELREISDEIRKAKGEAA